MLEDQDQGPSFEKLKVNLGIKNHVLNGIKFYDFDKLMVWGKKRNIEIFDLEKSKAFWKSKCGSRDELNLVVPILNQDVCINHGSSSLWVLDGLETIKLFDVSRQRKPVSKILVTGKEDVRLDKIISHKTGEYIYVSDVLGHLNVYDTRKTKTALKKIRHSFSCFSELAMTSDGESLGTVGLDRHFRGYKLQKGIPTLSCERYLKTKLYSLFMEGELQVLDEEDVPFTKKLGSGHVGKHELDEEKIQEQIHKKDKFDIEQIFPTRKEAVQIKLRNRIKKKVQEEFKQERKMHVKKVKEN
jgi:hypothetical protein